MANSKLYYYPQGATTAEAIDLGRKLSDSRLVTPRDRSVATAGWGSVAQHDRGGFRRVSIVLERLVSASLVRDLRVLVRHLKAGGVVAYCLDADKAWGSWADARPTAGDGTVTCTGGNKFSAFTGATSIAAGDEIDLESPNPEHLLDAQTVGSISGDIITLGRGVRVSFDQGPVFVRYRDFYPALRLPEGGNADALLTHDRRLNYTLDLELVELPGDIEALYQSAESLSDGSLSAPDEVATLDTILGGGPGSFSPSVTRGLHGFNFGVTARGPVGF